MKTITVALVGAGGRGGIYSAYIVRHPEQFQIVAVAEPRMPYREEFVAKLGLQGVQQFPDWQTMVQQPKLADAALVCTQDGDHYHSAMALLAAGYDLLLEKPMAETPAQCLEIAERARALGRKVVPCYVLRYTPFFVTLKRLLDEKRIGDVVSIEWAENVGYWHQALSFVRGPWAIEGKSTPMLLAKSCHDLDMFDFLLDARCERVTSFGSLRFFNAQHAPEGAPAHCQDGCPHKDTCPWYAPRFYVDDARWNAFLMQYAGVHGTSSREEKLAALRASGHDRCVFRCQNDVVDHQVAIFEYPQGVTISFTMSAFTQVCTRSLRVLGTAAELRGDLEGGWIDIHGFLGEQTTRVTIDTPDDGHAGGDGAMMRALHAMLQPGRPIDAHTDAFVYLQSNLLGFAAEQARRERKVVELADFAREVGVTG